MADINEQVEKMLADGKITQQDADEIENFAAFLTEAPPVNARTTPEEREHFRKVYAKYYPEDYARAVAEQQARQEQP